MDAVLGTVTIPLIPSPTTTHNCTNHDDDTLIPSEAQSSRALLITASDCFQAQDYNRVILLLEDASSTLPSSDTETAILLGCALAYYKIWDYRTSAAKFRHLEDSTSPDTPDALSLLAVPEARGQPEEGVQDHGSHRGITAEPSPQQPITRSDTRPTPAWAPFTTPSGTTPLQCSSMREPFTLAEGEGDFVSIAHAHGNIGNAYVGLHQKDKAISHLQKSLDLVLEHDPVPQAIGRAYNNLGTAYQSMGEWDRAKEYYELALGQCIYGKDLAGQARAYAEVSQVSSDLAIQITAHHNRGCCLCEKAREMTAVATVDSHVAQITFHGPSMMRDKSVLNELVRKLYEEALEDLRLVITSYETTLQSIKGSGEGLGLSVSLAENNSRTFHFIQDCLCALGRHFEALVFAEQSRSRSLGELLLKKKTSQEVGRTYSSPLSFEDMRNIVLAQSKDVVYLSYTANMFEVKLSGVLFNGSVLEAFLHNTMSEHIANSSLEMFEHCDYSQPSPLHPLHSVLVQPLLSVLTAVHSGHLPQEIVLVPDSNTLIPFTALLGSAGFGFLGDGLQFRVMPSILVNGADAGGRSLSSPRSPSQGTVQTSASSEIRPSHPSSTTEKTGGWVRLPHARREARPSSGSGDCLVDGSEVLLLPSEVEQMNIKAALVVLSSCDSGRGMVRADGIIGMGGPSSLLVPSPSSPLCGGSQTESAGMFMQFFYQYLVDGLGTTRALQKATLSVRCFRKYSQYTHWGGFQLIGRDVQFEVERSPQDKQVCLLLGRGSHAFPCLDLLGKMEGALLACPGGGDTPSDVQILHFCSGLSPEEPVIDFITKHHTHFRGGIFWVNGSSKCQLLAAEKELLTSMPSSLWKQGNSTSAPLSNPLPVTPPTEPMLIVLDNVCTEVTSEPMLSILRSCHAHIVVLTSRPVEVVREEVHTRLGRGSSVHVVESLSPLQATRRLVYALQSRGRLVPSNQEQDTLAQLADLSRGSPDLLDAFASLLLEHSGFVGSEGNRGLTDEIVLPRGDVICLESRDCSAQPDHAHLTLEDQLVLSSLSLFGETPIPRVVVDAIEGMVGVASPCSASCRTVERLKELHLVKQYPSLCVVKPCALNGEGRPVVLLRVPTLVADAIWSVLDDGGQVMAVAVAHRALREACRHVPIEDTYLSSLCAGLGVALAEAAVGVPRLTPECYAELCQPVVCGRVEE
eukprot:Em0019g255a